MPLQKRNTLLLKKFQKSKIKDVMRSTFAEIYINNFKFNLKEIRSKLTCGTKMCVAVKADAYGHGAVECARAAEEEGTDFLAVAAVSEGVELREAGISLPLLILSIVNPDEIPELVKYNITPLVFDEEYVNLINAECKRQNVDDFSVHLAVDTGMGRIGCYPEEAGRLALYISGNSNLKFGGICTHFSTADSLSKDDIEYTDLQFEKFLKAIDNVKQSGVNPGIRHCANSAITLNRPEMHLDMCRPGIIAYGYYPGDLNEAFFKEKGTPVTLKPVMALVTKVAAIRNFKAENFVSYGRTWTSEKDTKIAVLPVGYADGYLRRFTSKDNPASVSIGGKKFPVRGRICMDQCMVDIGSDDSVKRWDRVVLFGPEESGAIESAQNIADKTGTISYEITCGCAKERVSRVYIK